MTNWCDKRSFVFVLYKGYSSRNDLVANTWTLKRHFRKRNACWENKVTYQLLVKLSWPWPCFWSANFRIIYFVNAYVIVSQKVTYRALLFPSIVKSYYMSFRLEHWHLPCFIPKVKVKVMHFSIANISQSVSDRKSVTKKRKSYIDFRLYDLKNDLRTF